MEAFDGLSEDNMKDRTQEVVGAAQKAWVSYVEEAQKDNEPGQRVEMWEFWDIYTRMVSCVPYRHIGQRLLTDVVLELEIIGEETEDSAWKDLPELGQTLREGWNDDPTRTDLSMDGCTLEHWLSFNAWFARLVGSGPKRALNLMLWSIKEGLEKNLEKLAGDLESERKRRKGEFEEDLKEREQQRTKAELLWMQEHGLECASRSCVDSEPTKEDEAARAQPAATPEGPPDEASEGTGEHAEKDAKVLCPEAVTRVAVAAEYFIHAAPVILEESLIWHTRGPFDDQEQRIYRAGPLFAGTFGFNLERWGFWKRRLGELKSQLGDEEVERNVDEALEKMSAVEVAVARHL
ncbi:hypothetical protein COL154_003153 [Colletotrichum chrysophilum]|nr:hypothetical protein KNSL1_008326 [Colletotrichum chrysophilum]KAJ0367499.1 hypothetical protein COL154_003153 [Colletotrichum chrysophilum]